MKSIDFFLLIPDTQLANKEIASAELKDEIQKWFLAS